MVRDMIRSRGFKNQEQPFDKVGNWPTLSKTFWRFVPSQLRDATQGKFGGREIRRYRIKKILDEGGPDTDMKLRNLGEFVH